MATAKTAKATGPATSDGPTIDILRLNGRGAHLEGGLTNILRGTGKGRHFGWELAEDDVGVIATKDGKSIRFPWAMVQQVEYAS